DHSGGPGCYDRVLAGLEILHEQGTDVVGGVGLVHVVGTADHLNLGLCWSVEGVQLLVAASVHPFLRVACLGTAGAGREGGDSGHQGQEHRDHGRARTRVRNGSTESHCSPWELSPAVDEADHSRAHPSRLAVWELDPSRCAGRKRAGSRYGRRPCGSATSVDVPPRAAIRQRPFRLSAPSMDLVGGWSSTRLVLRVWSSSMVNGCCSGGPAIRLSACGRYPAGSSTAASTRSTPECENYVRSWGSTSSSPLCSAPTSN